TVYKTVALPVELRWRSSEEAGWPVPGIRLLREITRSVPRILEDLDHLELHAAAWGLHGDLVSNAGLHEGIAHRAGGRDVLDLALGLGRPRLADEPDEHLVAVIDVADPDGAAEEDHILRYVAGIGDDDRLELLLEVGQLPLDLAVLLLGEMVLGVLGQVAQAGGGGDAVLNRNLLPPQLFKALIQLLLLGGAEVLHGVLSLSG